MTNPEYPGFLPISREEQDAAGIKQFDFICVTGDAYVDHPSFGVTIIARLIESLGFTVGIIAQPDYKKKESFMIFGAPKYAFMVTSGCIDSMVSNYTVAKKPRDKDVYSPAGKPGKRPDRAVLVYCNKIREAYGSVPIVLGGLEASLRRFAHYDYWQDGVRRSILSDSGADLLSYGMGEHQTEEICKRLANGESVKDLHNVPGTCYLTKDFPEGCVICPSFDEVSRPDEGGKKAYAKAEKLILDEQDAYKGRPLAQYNGDSWLVQNVPAEPLDGTVLDAVYDLPYTRTYHPIYEKAGGVPAVLEVSNSVTHNRGCFGGCNFCAITMHQGRLVTSRTPDSVVREAEKITKSSDFKGYIHDVGGPTANFRHSPCGKQSLCTEKRCLAPERCPAMKVNHGEYLSILRRIRALPGVKKVFVRSGIRYDYLVYDKDRTFFEELVQYHISGQLKVAPEHCVNRVLDYMGKPHVEVYDEFTAEFKRINAKYGKKQYLVPYLISSHPGSTLKDAIQLALYLKKNNTRPEQVQDFYPTPGTVSTTMFYTGIDPRDGKKVYVPRDPKEKMYQRALLQYYDPKFHGLVREALHAAGRDDLIKVLIPPVRKGYAAKLKK